uniref:Uncharacterized protein n=1 Tax=Parascaris univalens TaxID=6257 RepID=A0A915C3U0_PARUN
MLELCALLTPDVLLVYSFDIEFSGRTANICYRVLADAFPQRAKRASFLGSLCPYSFFIP